MSERLVSLLALLALLAPASLAAQDWQTVTSFRQRSGEDRLSVELTYGAGRLSVVPGPENELYRATIRYDGDVFRPVTSYSAGRLRVGIESRGEGLKLRDHEAGELRLTLGRSVPTDLSLQFGAVEADLELGGVPIERLEVQTGASETEIRFSRPNPVRARLLKFSLGAAAVKLHGLGNANADRLEVEAGVGDITLDFAGEWRQDMRARIQLALGTITLYVPDGVGVAVEKETFLTGFDDAGFTKRGDVYYSRNWEGAARKLNVALTGAFGDVNVRWTRGPGIVR